MTAAGKGALEAGWKEVAALVSVVEIIGQRVDDGLDIAPVPSILRRITGMTAHG